jgi:signal recognition particle subunit SRP54
VLSLVEEVERSVDREKAEKLAQKMIKGKKFDLNDLRDQLLQMQNMGGLGSLIDKMPGMAGLKEKVGDRVNDKDLNKTVAIINSMTKKERRFPDLLNGSRKLRVAKGSGTQPADVNKVLKQHQQMEKMMSKLSGGGIKGMLRQMKGLMGPGGMMPPR